MRGSAWHAQEDYHGLLDERDVVVQPQAARKSLTTARTTGRIGVRCAAHSRPVTWRQNERPLQPMTCRPTRRDECPLHHKSCRRNGTGSNGWRVELGPSTLRSDATKPTQRRLCCRHMRPVVVRHGKITFAGRTALINRPRCLDRRDAGTAPLPDHSTMHGRSPVGQQTAARSSRLIQ